MSRTQGRHRKPTTTSRTVAKVALTGMVVGAPLTVLAAPASAASASQWDAVAQCESTGNWSIANGNGFYGGLQFTASTWKAFGGHAYAPQANQASKAQQIAIAERVLAGQGKGAWPVCGKVLTGSGNASATAGASAPQASTKSAPKAAAPKAAAPKAAAPKAAPKAVAPKAAAPKAAAPKVATKATTKTTTKAATSSAGTYTVKSGDTLSGIARSQGISGGYQAIFQLNKGTISNVNVIYPGQVLHLG
ncbi:transglycosylase family protein [Rhodococcus sp. X156]|uniref:transglycosylase family protein n=1 Tax=Rhodococcus sp. X156 TaxID=2499145 RepID=UPI000FD8B0E4|nr:transglycosylase family protein [Rhodococcus sp. X156]